MNFLNKLLSFLVILIGVISCTSSESINQEVSVKKVMDDVITRLYQEVPEEKYNAIDDGFILDFLTDEEKQVLATKYQYFKVNLKRNCF